ETEPGIGREPMELGELLEDVAVKEGQPRRAPAELEIASVAYDSRKVTPGALFVAIRGEHADGNRFVADALGRGAAAVVSENPRPAAGAGAPADVPAGVAWIQVDEPRRALAQIAANFYARPADSLELVGITGTNGKTTTSFLMDSILRAAGHSTGLFGTILYRTPKSEGPAKHTTPESLELQKFFAEVRAAGGSHVTMEVSSHALALDRVWGCRFSAAIFTNLTRDHLDFHKTMDAYGAAKRLLFEGTGAGRPRAGAVNRDDPAAGLFTGLAERTLTYGLSAGADVTTKRFAPAFTGLEFTAQTPEGKIEVASPLVGKINVYNILGAMAAAVGMGIPRAAIERGIHDCKTVPGRFERVDCGQPFLVIVDYAHTDDALRNLLQTARELNKSGRIITVFGCGGERDRTKRPLMGEAAGSLSDLVVLSSDNPRGEDPRNIINDALVGLQRTGCEYMIEPERAQAVAMAIERARPGDIVLLAGKGHETYQVLRDRTIDYDDREEARRVLRGMGHRG
ncbi:MAG TPA: UDP-N-acetylmuramoyl-L-alanyl-D-glutamate--2,6-diaminopimelate ligase, partial [Candidatus Acidoferrales bacterium]|nr:UDP-N-acetylmuramoyl-L-alanyl-D-glutamate--2,6-diaminopimelate ligase [Candidatus Acidoferrales bacterium]